MYITTIELAKRLKKSRQWVCQLAREGKIPCVTRKHKGRALYLFGEEQVKEILRRTK